MLLVLAPAGVHAQTAGQPKVPGATQPASAAGTLGPAPASAAGNVADDLSSQATDPTASLMSFNLINNFTTSYHGLDDSGYTFKFQPVVPFRAWRTANILRVVVPYQTSGPGDAGLKSVTIFDLVVLPQKWGRSRIGPVMSLSESAARRRRSSPSAAAVGAMQPHLEEAQRRRVHAEPLRVTRRHHADCSRSSPTNWARAGR